MPTYFYSTDSPQTYTPPPASTGVYPTAPFPPPMNNSTTGISGLPPPPPYYAPPEGPLPPPPPPPTPLPHAFPAPPTYGTMPGTMTTNWTQLRDEPRVVQCPHCGHLVETMTDYQNGSATFFSAALLFLFGCHAGGCLIPFCCPMCQDVNHACPACHTSIATYSRLSQNAVLES